MTPDLRDLLEMMSYHQDEPGIAGPMMIEVGNYRYDDRVQIDSGKKNRMQGSKCEEQEQEGCIQSYIDRRPAAAIEADRPNLTLFVASNSGNVM